jgi:hypothetical protein
MAGLLATFGLMALAFGAACIAHPRKGARAATVLALMAAVPLLVLWTHGLKQPNPPAVQQAVNFVHGVDGA